MPCGWMSPRPASRPVWLDGRLQPGRGAQHIPSPALCTPCSLMLLPGSWLGSGVGRTASVPAGAVPGAVSPPLPEHCCSQSCLIDTLDSILTIHPFLERNEKFQFQSLACFSLTCFSQQVVALLCRSLKLPLTSLTRRCSKTPVLCRKCKERRDSFTPNVRGDLVKLTLQ